MVLPTVPKAPVMGLKIPERLRVLEGGTVIDLTPTTTDWMLLPAQFLASPQVPKSPMPNAVKQGYRLAPNFK